MGRRGPKPQPAAMKLAKGRPGRRPVKDETPTALAATGAARPPEWLSDDGLAIWSRLAPELQRLHLLRPVDSLTFGRYCQAFAEWLVHKRKLVTEGDTYQIVTASGTVIRPHPSFNMAERLEKTMLAMEATFGLNPMDRQRFLLGRASRPMADGDLFAASASPPGAAAVEPGHNTPAVAESIIGTLN